MKSQLGGAVRNDRGRPRGAVAKLKCIRLHSDRVKLLRAASSELGIITLDSKYSISVQTEQFEFLSAGADSLTWVRL